MERIDITAEGNEEWFDLYQYDIPVFHLNGSFLMMHKGDLQLLNNALENLRKWQKHVYKRVWLAILQVFRLHFRSVIHMSQLYNSYLSTDKDVLKLVYFDARIQFVQTRTFSFSVTINARTLSLLVDLSYAQHNSDI